MLLSMFFLHVCCGGIKQISNYSGALGNHKFGMENGDMWEKGKMRLRGCL
jgi:hypothetical protein